ncbi:MAG: ribonuclease Y [Chloroflexi bacterium]|nr:ribonuclease Y [Chloroflexota bacterium]MDA1147460.1 ribonuclease Y [Chloroflexota bacterium]MQC83047.1 ribonuclease Y [Chloroflexota bacterium]
MESLVIALVAVGAFALGGAALYFLFRVSGSGMVRRSQDEAATLVGDARREARELTLDAEKDALTRREAIDVEARESRRELTRAERRLEQREEALDRRTEQLDRNEQSVRDRSAKLDGEERRVVELEQSVRGRLEVIAQLTAEEARERLLADLDVELRDEASRRVRAMETSAKSEAGTRSRKILATVMQRMTSEVTAETTVSTVALPSDDLKGRIIGREGRNIRAFEAATGCDLIIDDTPGLVTVSGFDPVRREIARQALAKLVQDGRIQPIRIEEAVVRARKDVEQTVKEAGEQAAVDAEVTGLHPEVIKTLGRLKFRYSYGQNQLRHALETSWLAAALAFELGADAEIARVGGLLHDLGKAVDRETEGTHALIGADIAKRFGVSRDIVHCIEAHHEEVKPETVEALIVICADAMSGSRPGARRESADQYIKRLEALEAIANSYDGVEEAFAIQAGREIRIMVRPETVDDVEATRLARDVSRKIEETLQYPGEIRVTVIRETRASAVAH